VWATSRRGVRSLERCGGVSVRKASGLSLWPCRMLNPERAETLPRQQRTPRSHTAPWESAMTQPTRADEPLISSQTARLSG
jgi:hypothetical protein